MLKFKARVKPFCIQHDISASLTDHNQVPHTWLSRINGARDEQDILIALRALQQRNEPVHLCSIQKEVLKPHIDASIQALKLGESGKFISW